MEQNILVAVYLESSIILGTVTIPEGSRVSDFLNAPAKFLKLNRRPGHSGGESAEPPDEILINKDAITMLCTLTDNAARGAGLEKKYPYNVKMPVRVNMSLNDYQLSGNLHTKTETAIPQLIEQQLRFLPATEVKIHDIRHNTHIDASFTAVNRNHLTTLQKEAV